jgi:hypothetical protein
MIISDLNYLESLTKNEIIEGGFYSPIFNINNNIAITTQIINIANAGFLGYKPNIDIFMSADVFQLNDNDFF